MNEIIEKIKKLASELKELQPMKTEFQHALDKKFRLEFNYNSNHLEGNTLTYSETELLLIFDDTKGDHSLREYEEMKGSDVAYQIIKEWATDNERSLTEQNIKNLNEILLVRPFWKEAITPEGQQTRRLIKVGDYKEFPNSVRLENGEIFEYASPANTPILMGELIEWYKSELVKNELHPVILAALLHYKYVCIHPFDDGNGRISRLLMNYVLFKNNLPPIIIKTIDKRNYLNALNRADSGDVENFINYIATQLIWSLELSIKASKGLSLDEPGDLDKKIWQLKQQLNSANEEVKIIRSKESITDTCEKNIFPFLQNLSKKIGQLDNLFKSKEEYIVGDGLNLGRTLSDSTNNFKERLKGAVFAKVYYTCKFISFRKKTTEFSVELNFEIGFHLQVYELKSVEPKFSISKLYDQQLSPEESDNLIELLGTSLFNKIQNNLKD